MGKWFKIKKPYNIFVKATSSKDYSFTNNEERTFYYGVPCNFSGSRGGYGGTFKYTGALPSIKNYSTINNHLSRGSSYFYNTDYNYTTYYLANSGPNAGDPSNVKTTLGWYIVYKTSGTTNYTYQSYNDFIYSYNSTPDLTTNFINSTIEKRSVFLNGKYIIKYNINQLTPTITNPSIIFPTDGVKLNGIGITGLIHSSRTYTITNNTDVNLDNISLSDLYFCTSTNYNSDHTSNNPSTSLAYQLILQGNSVLSFDNTEVHEDFANFILAIADPQDQIVLTFGDSAVLANKPVTEINVVKKTLNLVDVTIDGTTSEVEIHPQEGKVFLGFSLQEGSTVATIPIGTTKITLNENTTFYEVWGTYKPEPNFFTANFYQNCAENHRVDKTEYLTSIFSAGISLREETNIIHPTIILQYDKVPDFNYCYIEYFGRYYYVTDIISIRNNIWQINLSVDVLMSFKDIIKTQNGNIIRQENIGNTSMPDNQIPVTGIPKIQFLEFSQPSIILDNDVANAFDGDRTSINYVLITQGVGFIE